MTHPFFYSDTQVFILPSNCETGDTVGDVHVLWSHVEFHNDFFGTSFGWSNYIYSIVGGNADGAFSINSATGRLWVANAALFGSTREITIRATLPDGSFGDCNCQIQRVLFSNCVFFDSSVVGNGGSGTRSDPYQKWSVRQSVLGNGEAGKTYLYKRGQTFQDYIEIYNPLVDGELPEFINIGAWGVGDRPVMNLTNNTTAQRFLNHGWSGITNSNHTANEGLKAFNVRVLDIITTQDTMTNRYAIQVAQYCAAIHVHRCRFENTTFADGHVWMRSGMEAGYYPGPEYKSKLFDVEFFQGTDRSLKIEDGNVMVRNVWARNEGSASTETPISAANHPDVDCMYGWCSLDNNDRALGLQIRSLDHTYRFFYLKGYKNPLVVFRHTSHNAYPEGLYAAQGKFEDILIDGVGEDIGITTGNGGIHIPKDVVYRRIKVKNATSGFLSVDTGSKNFLIESVDTGESNGIWIGPTATETVIRHVSVPTTIRIDASSDDTQLENSWYSNLTGSGGVAMLANQSSPAASNFVDYPTDLRLVEDSSLRGAGTASEAELDLYGREFLNPPSIGAYEFVEDVPPPPPPTPKIWRGKRFVLA